MTTTFDWPDMVLTFDAAETITSGTLSADVELIGDSDFDEEKLFESAQGWAQAAANTNTAPGCDDEEDCGWYFDGYALQVGYADSASPAGYDNSGTEDLYVCV